jgi:hypothetical protein
MLPPPPLPYGKTLPTDSPAAAEDMHQLLPNTDMHKNACHKYMLPPSCIKSYPGMQMSANACCMTSPIWGSQQQTH